MRLLLMGPPGAGKGTVAPRLAERYGLLLISTGDLFRKARRDGTELGRAAAGFLDAGTLVPDGVTRELIERELAAAPTVRGLLLDGFPRNHAQAEVLDALLTRRGGTITAVLWLTVPRETLVARLAARRVCAGCGKVWNLLSAPPPAGGRCDVCGGAPVQRADDREEVVSRRLDVFESQTGPLREHFRQRGLLREVSGAGEPAEVLARVAAVADGRATSAR